jgi:hypothetical protein
MMLEHKCGQELSPQLICEACGEPVIVAETKPVRNH